MGRLKLAKLTIISGRLGRYRIGWFYLLTACKYPSRPTKLFQDRKKTPRFHRGVFFSVVVSIRAPAPAKTFSRCLRQREIQNRNFLFKCACGSYYPFGCIARGKDEEGYDDGHG